MDMRRRDIMSRSCRVRLILVFALMLLTGCTAAGKQTGADTANGADEKLNIITTIFAPYDIAKQVTGEHAEVRMLLKPGSESHSYEPTPADMIAIGDCDVFIYSGGENDEWVETILSAFDDPNPTLIQMLECVDALAEEEVDGMQEEGGALAGLLGLGHHHEHTGEEEDGHEDHDHEDHEHETEWDEHVWMSPKNAGLIAEEICRVCSERDPENSSIYEQNLNGFLQKLDAVDTELREVITAAPVREMVFADRFPARYFVEEYGLDYYAAFPGCSENTEASAHTVSFLIDKVREDGLKYIFKIELSAGKLAAAVSEETGAEVLTFYTGHNISADDLKSGMTYISMMERNLEALKKALY